MLWCAFNNMRLVFYKVDVTLRRCIFYKRKEVFHVIERAFKYGIYKFIPQYRLFSYFSNNSFNILFMNIP
jgi:hypothetical protein